MSFELPPLPYAPNSLAPFISEETISFHYGKHHAAYVKNLDDLVAGTDLADWSLDEVIMGSDGKVFNNAAQIWNHTCYWHSMSPDGGGPPPDSLATALRESFGSVDAFCEQFANEAKAVFGSGWTWLVADPEGLSTMTTANADLPMRHGRRALLTLDVWEHAYYLDYQNARPAYVDAFVEHLVNWEFAAENFRRGG